MLSFSLKMPPRTVVLSEGTFAFLWAFDSVGDPSEGEGYCQNVVIRKNDRHPGVPGTVPHSPNGHPCQGQETHVWEGRTNPVLSQCLWLKWGSREAMETVLKRKSVSGDDQLNTEKKQVKSKKALRF